MKRFYCTVCKKVKRVQKWPMNRSFSPDNLPINTNDRIGSCNRHHASYLKTGKMHKLVNTAEGRIYRSVGGR